jgi:NitT/TauT family transport system substrate-binding protein
MAVLTLLVAVALTAAACGSEEAQNAGGSSSGEGLKQVRLLTSSFPSGHASPYFLGLEKGFFRDAGIDLEISDGTGTGPTIQAVTAGKFEFGNAAMSSVALAAGAPNKPAELKVVAGWMRKTDLAWFVPKESDIKTGKDLEGKSALYSPESLETPFMPWFWREAGVDKSKVELLTTSLASKYQTYSAGKADAMVTVRQGYSPIAPKARPSRVINWADYGVIVPSFGLFTTPEIIEKDPEMVKSFVAAAVKSYAYSVASKEAMEEATEAQLKHRPDSDRAILLAGLEDAVNFLSTESTKDKPLGANSEEDWAAVLDYLRREKLVREDLQASDVFTNEYIPSDAAPAPAAP